MNTCRLAVSAAFVRAMPGYQTVPKTRAIQKPVTIYHANPHGLRDGLRRRVHPGAFVDTTTVHERKTSALRCHRSQDQFLDVTQGMSSYLRTMDDLSREVGALLGPVRSRRRMAPAPALGILRTRRRSAARRARRTVSDQSTLRRVARTMPRKLSAIAPDWWDYTTLDSSLIDEAARLTARDLQRLSRPGLQGRALRHARGVLSRRGARIHRCVAAEHRRRAGRHLRADRPDRAAAAGRADRQLARPRRTRRSFLGHGRVVRRRHRPRSAGDASFELRTRRSRAVLQPHPPAAADAGRAPALPQGRHGRLPSRAGTPACAAR